MDLTVEVVGRRLLAEDVAELTISAVTGEKLPAWGPGAHIRITLPGDLSRHYSLCGDPADLTSYRIAVLRTRESQGGSVAIHEQLRVGDRVEISPPVNRFALEPSASYVFFAGGIGVTPIRPMLDACHSRAVEWRLHYGGRTREAMAFGDEILEHFDTERVQLHPEDESGYIDVAAALRNAARDALIYVCGPQPLIDLVRSEARAQGRTAYFRSELFAAEQVEDTSGDEEFDLQLQNTGMTVTVPCGTSALEALEAAGVEMESDCQSGVCGTCITSVVSGEIDHRDHVLSDREKCSNESMAICVSRALGNRIVINA